MYLRNIAILSLLHLTVSAKYRHQHRSFGPATTTTITITETRTETESPTSTGISNTNSTTPDVSPAGPYTVIASRSGSPFDQLNLTASGGNFTLSSSGPAVYCPESVKQCPSGNVTAFLGHGAMDAEVPGGQLVYVTNNGRLGYTQAHSASYPPGSVLAPFSFTNAADNSSVTVLNTYAFDAPSLMACAIPDGGFQVFAAMSNASVPTGNISDCTAFVAICSVYGGPPVWQYV